MRNARYVLHTQTQMCGCQTLLTSNFTRPEILQAGLLDIAERTRLATLQLRIC